MRKAGVFLGVIALLIILAVALTGCGSKKAETPEPAKNAPATGDSQKAQAPAEPLKIGAIFDITGGGSSLGVPERDTAKLVEEQINAKGGIKGRPVKLVIEDNQSNETQTLQVAKKLVEVDQVIAIAGPSQSGTSMAIVDYMQKAQVPLVSAAASAQIVEPIADRKWIFKSAQNTSVVTQRIIEYLKKEKMTKVAFISMNNAYGEDGRKVFEGQAAQNGITVVAWEKFAPDDKDMKTQVTRIKAKDPQAVIIWAIPPSASIVTKNYRELGVKAPLIHSHGIGNQAFIDLAGKDADGVIFPVGRLLVAEKLPDSDPQKQVLTQYAKDYETKFKSPRSTFGGHGWDAVSLIINAIDKAGTTDRAKVRDTIENTKNFVGVSGVFNMSPQDHSGLNTEALVMVKIANGKWDLLE